MPDVAERVKLCHRCGTVKPHEHFARNRSRKDGLQVHCRECYAEHSRRYYADNKDRVKARADLHYLNNKERRNALARQWRESNRERHDELVKRWASENRELRKLSAQRAREQRPEIGRIAAAAHRAAKRSAIPLWADQDTIKSIYLRASADGMDVDHIVPLQSKYVCGLHVESNLRPLSPTENKSKGNRHWPDMWPDWKA